MNILQITKKFPYPVKDGEIIGIFNLTQGFAEQGHQVTVFSLNTKKHYSDITLLPENVKKTARFIAVDIDTSLNPLAAFVNLFSAKSYNIERFYSAEFEQKLAALLRSEHFDLILLEGIYLMRYIDVIRKNTNTKVLLRPQNVEFVIWERLRQTETNLLKKMYLGILAERMKKFELENIHRADILIPVSATDLEIFRQHGCHLPATAIPTGFVYHTLPEIGEEENAVAFIGSLDWQPNREGVEWFIEKVWPLIIAQVPQAKFYLAGRNFPEEIKAMKVKGLVIVGEVENAPKFVFSKSISIVPLFAGSGMRVKIIEAMAMGRAIVSTTVGAESLAYTHEKDILIADEHESFANAVVRVLKNTSIRKSLGQNAQSLVASTYDNRKICSAIIDFCKSYL